MTAIEILMTAVSAFGLGMFTAMFLYAWLEAQSDQYANIPWSRVLDTCVRYPGKGC